MRICVGFGLALGLLACGDGDEGGGLSGPSGSLAVTQGGAQDIEHFRTVLEDGDVPAIESFDQMGFFAEHAFDQPEADCGHSVCVHPQLAVAPRFDDGNWTMAFASFNSPVRPETRERASVHVALVIETSARTSAERGALAEGVTGLVDGLPEGDRVTLVTYGALAQVQLDAVEPANADVTSLLTASSTQTGAALYEGLALAVDRIRFADPAPSSARIVLVTTGHASGGIEDAERIVQLAEGAAREGIGMSILGLGDDYDARIPTRLAELGTATLTFSDEALRIDDLLAAQAALTLIPLATDFELRIVPAEGYAVGEVHGARHAHRDGESVVLQAPGLFLGARTGADDVDAMVGRRGGGGGVFVRLWADGQMADEVGSGAPAFTAQVRYRDHDSGEDVRYEQVIENALAPAENPDRFWPHFSDEDHAKPFMMLNMWLAVNYALQLYQEGRCDEAMGVSEMMEPTVDAWQEVYDDPDIQADAELLHLLRANIADNCAAQPVPPAYVDLSCFAT